MAAWQEVVYSHSPILIQNLACNWRGHRERALRHGGEFRSLLAWLQESEWWSSEEIEAYQEERLAQIIRHAYETVPYYRRMFDQLKLKPADVRSRDDLQKLPLLSKEDFRQHRDEFFSSRFSRNQLVFCHTSGTTGKSLQFYLEPYGFSSAGQSGGGIGKGLASSMARLLRPSRGCQPFPSSSAGHPIGARTRPCIRRYSRCIT